MLLEHDVCFAFIAAMRSLLAISCIRTGVSNADTQDEERFRVRK